MAPLFRADQVGSLLRPAALLDARKEHQIISSYDSIETSPAVAEATRTAVTAVVKRQIDLSIFPLTTGELERSIFYGGFFETLPGFTTLPALPVPGAFRTNLPSVAALQHAGIPTRPGVIATGKITWASPAYGASWSLLQSCVPDDDPGRASRLCKTTIPSPTYQHMQLAPGTAYTSASGYATDEAYFSDLAAAYRAELRALHGLGCHNVQVDDPNLTFFVMDEFLAGCRVDGVDPAALLDLYVRVHNDCLADRPADMHMGIHLCRGNMWSSVVERGVGGGSYEGIAEKVFGELNYDSFYLEYDDERSGDFEPLRFLPRGKVVVLGLVSTKNVELESMGVLVRRVHEAAAVIARGQGRSVEEVLQDSLAVSPQCGFASQHQGGGAGMTEERQWEKLTLVRDLARTIWKDAA